MSFRCRTEFPSHKNKQGKNYSVNGNWSFAITLILYLAPALIIPQSLLRQKIWFETKEAFVSNEGSFSRMTLSCLFFSIFFWITLQSNNYIFTISYHPRIIANIGTQLWTTMNRQQWHQKWIPDSVFMFFVFVRSDHQAIEPPWGQLEAFCLFV